MWRDLIHGLRLLAAAPALSAVVVASLAIGIGVNVAVFSWVQVFALTPLPGVPRAAEFHLIEPRGDAGAYPGTSWQEYQDLRAGLAGVAQAIAFRMAPFSVGEANQTERAFALLVSEDYFSSLGVRPVSGRVLGPGDVASPGASPVAVVSHRFWQSRLAGDPAAIGRPVRVNGVELAVVGVLPDGFQGTVLGLQFDLWIPATMAPVVLGGSSELEDRRSRGYTVMARLPRAGRRRRGVAGGGADDAHAGRAVPGEQPRPRRRGAAVLARAARAAAHVLRGLERPAGPDAPAAGRGVRQHRHAAARPIGVTTARTGHPPGDRRLAVAGCAAAPG